MNGQKPNIFFSLLAALGWILCILTSAPLFIALGATHRFTEAIVVSTIWNFAYIANFMLPAFNRDWTSLVFNLPIWIVQQIAMVITIAVTVKLQPIFIVVVCLICIPLLAVMQFSAWYMQRHGFKTLHHWWNWQKNAA